MDTLTRLADQLQALPLALRQAAVVLVQQFGQELLDYNRNYLQQQGQRPDGESIQAEGYSPAYKSFKAKYGRFTNTAFVDLKFSGDFLEAYQLEYSGGLQFEIVNNDKKAQQLLTRYGELLGIRLVDIQDFIASYLVPGLRLFLLSYFD